MDPDTLQRILEQHRDAVVTLVGQFEANLASKIDTLVEVRKAAAEGAGPDGEPGKKDGSVEEIADLKREISGLRTVVEELPAGLRQQFTDLKKSIDKREGGVFAGIDGVAENVKPAADALKGLRQAVAGTTAAARDVAAIKTAVVDSRSAVDEVVTIRKTVANSDKAIADVVAMRPVLDKIEAVLGTWSTNSRRLRRFGWTLLVVLALLFCAGGVWLQRETGIWTPLADVENRERDAFWERHGEQITVCRDTARKFSQAMACTIVVMDP